MQHSRQCRASLDRDHPRPLATWLAAFIAIARFRQRVYGWLLVLRKWNHRPFGEKILIFPNGG
jgi:hypothetical protein